MYLWGGILFLATLKRHWQTDFINTNTSKLLFDAMRKNTNFIASLQ